MKTILAIFLFATTITCIIAEIPSNIIDHPNVTVSGIQCPLAEVGYGDTTQIQQCGKDAVFCTVLTLTSVSAVCRQCHVALPPPGVRNTGAADFYNMCNCPAGQYCRMIRNNGFVSQGTCVPYTRIGRACSSDDNCVSEYGQYGSSPSGTTTDQDGKLFCYQGFCRECAPSNTLLPTQGDNSWQVAYGVSVGEPYVCPGIDGPRSTQAGFRWYLSSYPGETRTCYSNGTLTSGGQRNWNLISVPFPSSTTSSGTTTDDSNHASELIMSIWSLTAMVGYTMSYLFYL